MILSYDFIKKELEQKKILIDPFVIEHLNPNSYDLTLSDSLYIIDDEIIDVKKKSNYTEKIIPKTGIVLEPNKIYLASTNELTHTDYYIPIVFGKSSLSRCGLSIHSTGGFGDVGFNGKWTLTLSCIKPIKIYPNMKICQVAFFEILGVKKLYDSKKYQNNKGIVISQLYEEYKEE